MEQEPLNIERVGFNQFILQNDAFRRVMFGALGVWTAAVSVAGVKNVELRETFVTYSDESLTYIDSINERSFFTESPSTELPTEIVPATTLPLPPPETTTTTAPPRLSEQLGLEVDPRIEATMSSMDLSVDGYNRFLQSIDTSPLSFSQQFSEFNGKLLELVIPQRPTEIFVAHFTVIYANDEPGFGTEMMGNFNVFNLIQSMAARGGLGTTCCGVNFAIGRDAQTYQTAGIDAKLSHNPPYNEISIGAEVESIDQLSITTAQYESLAYLAIATLDTKGLLGVRPLEEIFQGHGEMRDRIIDDYNSTNPDHRLGVRDDFNYNETALLRYFMQKYLNENPQLIGLKPLQNFS